jgi:hydrogenase maturation protease
MEESKECSDVVIAGFGSPHGDDQAGWQVADRLAGDPAITARVLAIREGTQLLTELEGCRKLLVVDACRSMSPLGTITRFHWPDRRIGEQHSHSTHGIGLCNSLELAARLGRIPADVEVFGIEISGPNPLADISCEVRSAVDELVEILRTELCEAVHA